MRRPGRGPPGLARIHGTSGWPGADSDTQHRPVWRLSDLAEAALSEAGTARPGLLVPLLHQKEESGGRLGSPAQDLLDLDRDCLNAFVNPSNRIKAC